MDMPYEKGYVTMNNICLKIKLIIFTKCLLTIYLKKKNLNQTSYS